LICHYWIRLFSYLPQN